jgi:hypothetical protein
MIGFIGLLQNVTTNNYDSLIVTHSKDHCNYSTHTKSPQFLLAVAQ